MKTNDVLKGLGVIGAAVAAYFLFEPKKGPQRRKKIAKMSSELYSGAGEEISKLGSEIGRVSSGLTSSLSGVVDRVGEFTGLSSGTASGTGRRRTGTKRRRSTPAHNGEA